MKINNFIIPKLFYILFGSFTLAFLVMFGGLIGVLAMVYSPDSILTQLALFKTLTIDRFVMLLCWDIWAALATICGIVAIKRGIISKRGGIFSSALFLSLLPFFICFTYVLFDAKILSFVPLVLLICFSEYLIYATYFICRSIGAFQSGGQQIFRLSIAEYCLTIGCVCFGIISILL